MKPSILLVSTVLCAACQTTRPFKDADRAALADSLGAFARQMVAEISDHKVDAFIAHHDNVPGFAWASQGDLISLDSMHATMRSYFAGPQGAAIQFAVAEAKAHALSRDAGAVTAIITAINRDSTGAEVKTRQAWSIVVERRGGEWKVVQVHESYPTGMAP